MADGSVVTSGIYERAFESNGVLYHHILDPHTGYPAHTDLLGATIMSDTSLDGDGFTTALIIMGAQQALHFAESYPGIEALFMTKSGEVLATSGLGQSIPLHIRADRPLPMHSEGLD
jgi:thiamine biosynthesis lipoprotein